MTHDDDTNGNGMAKPRFYQRSLVVPLTVVVTFGTLLVVATIAYTRVDDRSIENTKRIERVEERIIKRLDQIFELLWGSE